ncbi:MAG: DUF4154 domain-containing protein [Bacteroidales bacterium]|nr:DUF4154 domain-containing protein [Bacteroidales bacterium]
MRKILIFISLIAPFFAFSQKYSDSQIKAAYIYNFVVNMEWPEENSLDEFKIAVLGNDTSVVPYLRLLESDKKVRNLPIKIIANSDIDFILSQNPQAIFVTKDMNTGLKSLYYSIITKPILLISDDAERILYVMLNFIYTDENKISFELNKKNIQDQGLDILPKLLVLGGTELDVRELYKLKEEELENEKEIVKTQELKLEEQSKQIEAQLLSIQQQNILIETRKKSIDSLKFEVDKQKNVLATQGQNLLELREEITLQQNVLKQKLLVLEQQKDSIEAQQWEISNQKAMMDENTKRLESLNDEISMREKDIEKQKAELSNLQGTVESQKKFMGLMGLVILLVLVIVIIIYRNFKQKKRLSEELSDKNSKIQTQSEELQSINHELRAQKEELIEQKQYIEHQNEYITGSIRYAKRIQNALLPNLKEISAHFENFLLYRPKDIVSGDFYWYFTPKKDLHFIAVIDCTGHGVPGSLMSMIGSRMISEIVSERKIYSPKQIFEHLNRGLTSLLKTDSTEMTDGMDVILCRIDNTGEKTKLTYAGAKRPLIYYNRKTKQAKRIRGVRRSIGGFFQNYTNEQYAESDINASKGDVIYLTTDGYIDQNNPERVRFGTPRLMQIIQQIGNKNMDEQNVILISELDNWQKNEQQRDDIAILGIKI